MEESCCDTPEGKAILRAGNTVAKRDGFYAFLAARGDIIDFFRAKGWTWISPAEAFKDPAYALMPKNLPERMDQLGL